MSYADFALPHMSLFHMSVVCVIIFMVLLNM